MRLKDCTIRHDGRDAVVDILIEEGTITRIGSIPHYHGDTIDVKRRLLLPGIIDPHVHFREPGLTHKEDFRTGSEAAAAGGVTTVLDMPNTIPPTTTVALLEEKRRLAKKSVVNYGFHFGATEMNLDDIRKVRNIASVKVFLNISTGLLMMTDAEALQKVFRASKLVSVHAEDMKVREVVELTKTCGNRLYLCHISQKSELLYLKSHRSAGVHIEVTPHHLFLHDDSTGYTKMKPELRADSDRSALMAELDGLIDTIGSDHAPHTRTEKESKDPAWGIPGTETMLPLMLDAVNRGFCSLDTVIRLCCENPAVIFRIRRKGRIAVGYDADLTVVDMGLARTVRAERLHSKCGWSPYEGMRLSGWPVMTIVNGAVVYDHGTIVAAGTGREVEFDEGTGSEGPAR